MCLLKVKLLRDTSILYGDLIFNVRFVINGKVNCINNS